MKLALDKQVMEHLAKMDYKTQELHAPLFRETSADPWIRDVLLAYYRYFILVLQDDLPCPEAEPQLLHELMVLIPKSYFPLPSIREIEDIDEGMELIDTILAAEFCKKGYYFLGGRTLPFFGPYIWKRMESRIFDVEIPAGIQRIKVHFMHEFLIRSWYHFNTYGDSGAAGWAKWGQSDWEDGLYCVFDAYHLTLGMDDIAFQISLLKHEAQHLLDLQEDPSMQPVDLEYRAKLVELIYMTSIEGRFISILHEANNDPSDPHRQAAYRIVQNFSSRFMDGVYVADELRWRQLKYSFLQEEAGRLLDEHTLTYGKLG